MKIYVGSDNLITLTELYDTVAAAYVNDATVKGELYTFADQVTQIGDDVVMSYIAASDGNYRGQLPNGVALVLGTTYIMKITVTNDSNVLVIKVNVTGAYPNES